MSERPDDFPWDDAELRGVWQSAFSAGEGHPSEVFAWRLWKSFKTMLAERYANEWRNEAYAENFCKVCRHDI